MEGNGLAYLHYLIQSMILLVKSLVLLIDSYQKRWEPYFTVLIWYNMDVKHGVALKKF
ncbi:hypothetical protein DOT_0946 [Desulfosporosinus sp. OT]|nr:hypothetical protein DOT_0946 [Desulfosporosinus sp. OT]